MGVVFFWNELPHGRNAIYCGISDRELVMHCIALHCIAVLDFCSFDGALCHNALSTDLAIWTISVFLDLMNLLNFLSFELIFLISTLLNQKIVFEKRLV